MAARRALGPHGRLLIERDFYRAVGAYLRGDYRDARRRIAEILRLDPGNQNALALRRRVRAAERVGARALAVRPRV